MSQKDSNYYTVLKDPSEFRKSLLLSSKELITIMKSQETIKKIREEKKQLKKKIRINVTQIYEIMNKIKQKMPIKDIPVKKQKEVVEEKKSVKTKKVKPTKEKKVQMIHKNLNDQLKNIEDKLKNL